VSVVTHRIRAWRPRTPPLPAHLAGMVGPDDPDRFARELAVAAAPPWWFWRRLLRWSPVVPAVPADRPVHVDPTRPTTATAAFPGGVVPGDIPA
jgi:hypothetical protein